jgi:hypothetical protein
MNLERHVLSIFEGTILTSLSEDELYLVVKVFHNTSFIFFAQSGADKSFVFRVQFDAWYNRKFVLKHTICSCRIMARYCFVRIYFIGYHAVELASNLMFIAGITRHSEDELPRKRCARPNTKVSLRLIQLTDCIANRSVIIRRYVAPRVALSHLEWHADSQWCRI